MGFAWHTARKDLLQRLRDPLGMLTWIAIPLLLGGLMSLLSGTGGDSPGLNAKILVSDHDESIVSQFLLTALDGQSGGAPFTTELVSDEVGRTRIDDGDATAFLIIPEGFGEALLAEDDISLPLVLNPSQRILPEIVEETLEVAVDAGFYGHRLFGEPLAQIQGMVESATGGELPDAQVAKTAVAVNQIMSRISSYIDPPALDVNVNIITKKTEVALGFGEMFFPSMLFMTILFLASSQAEEIWREKTGGTLRRALITPHGAASFLGGKLLATACLLCLFCLVGSLAAKYVFGINLINVPLAAVWCAISGSMLYLILLLLQLHAGSQSAGSLLGNVIVMPLLMLGGSFFPFEMMPDFLARIGRWTPNGWALMQLKGILSGSFDMTELGLALVGLVVFSAVVFALSVRRTAGGFVNS